MEDMGIQIRYCAPSVCMSKTKNYLLFDSHTCYQNQYNYSRSLTNNMNKAITHNSSYNTQEKFNFNDTKHGMIFNILACKN